MSMNPFSNPSYLMPPLVSLFVSLILAVVIWRGTSRQRSSLLFLGFLLGLGLTSALIFGMRSSGDVYQAVVFLRVANVAGFVTFLLYYHFTIVYTKRSEKRYVLLTSYLLLIVLVGIALTTNLIAERVRVESYGYAGELGPVGSAMVLVIMLFIIGGAYNLFKMYRASLSYEERNRLLYLIIGPVFPIVGGFLDAFTNLPPAAIWGNLICGIISTVVIVRYHLLDIRVVIRKSLVFMLMSVFVAIPYVGTLFSLAYFFNTRATPWWVHSIVILLLAVALRPLYSWAQQMVDRAFYRDRYNYLRALQQFSQETQSVENLNELGSTLVHLVVGALRTSSACLLLVTQEENNLVLLSSFCLNDTSSKVVPRNINPIFKWLEPYGDTLSSKDLCNVPQLRSLTIREKRDLERMGVELYVPLKNREGKLSGVLLLGTKLSQQSYSDEDKQLLTALSGQMAMALENARLYDDARKVRENLETWLNGMSDCVIIVSSDYKIQFTNRASIEGFSSRIGQICWQTFGRDTNCSFCPIHSNPNDNMREMRYTGSIGDRQYDIVVGTLINPGGSLSVIEVLRDITERKRLEDREKQMQRELNLARRLASIGELAAGIAHEINNPLTGILGFSEYLLRKNTDKNTREDLKVIYDEAMRAANVVNNLRTFARSYDSKKEFANINDILKKALELRTYEMRNSNIEVVTELASDLPLIKVDFHQLQQVFINIVMNAEQAITETKSYGKLSIVTKKIKNFVRISFTDDGPGIPAELLDKIFDPFFSTKTESGGTGLGLSICHGIVTEHGGKIYTQSKLGKGTTFFVELPVKLKR